MWLLVVRGASQPGTADEFARKWHEVYSVRFPEMPEFERAYFSADHEMNAWFAVAVWNARPDETRLSQAIQELGAQIGSLMVGPPSAEWLEVLQQIESR